MKAFQITIFGFVIISAYSFAIVVVVLALSRLLKSVRWRWWLLGPPALLLMALPWAEEAWIAWHFSEACKDAGVTVYRQVEVEGYASKRIGYTRKGVETGPLFNSNQTKEADFEREGYRFVEDWLTDGGSRHLEREAGRVMVSIREKPEARYYYKYAYEPDPYTIEEPMGWKLEKIESQVIDNQSGEILGRDVLIHRGFPVHEVLLLQFFGTPMLTCPSPKVKPYTPPLPFPQAVLKPLSRR